MTTTATTLPPEPPLLRLLSHLVYLSLLVLLVGMTVMGPVTRLMSRETAFVEGFRPPSELPAPTITVCKVGARREALKVHHTFFILDDNETFVQGNFSGLEDFYRAADLRREESLVYTPPIWSPKPSDWRPTPVDPLFFGSCYNLDLSSKLSPEEPWVLSLAFDEYLSDNGDDDNDDATAWSPEHNAYFVAVRDPAEDFLATPFTNFQREAFAPQGKMVDVGKLYTVRVEGKILEYSRDCSREVALTDCVGAFADGMVASLANGSGSPEPSHHRTSLVNGYRLRGYHDLQRETGCKKPCLNRLYDLVAANEFHARTVLDVGPLETRIYVSYHPQTRIPHFREIDAYGFTNFYADCGGLSGLLLGLSLYDLFDKVKEKMRLTCAKM